MRFVFHSVVDAQFRLNLVDLGERGELFRLVDTGLEGGLFDRGFMLVLRRLVLQVDVDLKRLGWLYCARVK